MNVLYMTCTWSCSLTKGKDHIPCGELMAFVDRGKRSNLESSPVAFNFIYVR